MPYDLTLYSLMIAMDNNSTPATPVASSLSTYRIGVVSRLTGIPPVTIRMWERRYGVVEPDRSQGRNRLYSREDITRLTLIKQLVDVGNAISTVANLSLKQLNERLQSHDKSNTSTPVTNDKVQSCRVAIFGDTLAVRITPLDAALYGINLVSVQRDYQQFLTDITTLRPNIIIVECPAVYEDTLNEVQTLLNQSGATRALVIYGFGTRNTIDRLDNGAILPVRAPVDLPELRQLIATKREIRVGDRAGFYTTPPSESIPPRRFTTETLNQIALASTAVKCECPGHLVDLIVNLNAFEEYSATCKGLNKEDAAVHARLQIAAAEARALIEAGLADVVAMEGTKLPPT
jgi:DNA-binding transcriptional MerR regulator